MDGQIHFCLAQSLNIDVPNWTIIHCAILSSFTVFSFIDDLEKARCIGFEPKPFLIRGGMHLATMPPSNLLIQIIERQFLLSMKVNLSLKNPVSLVNHLYYQVILRKFLIFLIASRAHLLYFDKFAVR